MFDAIRNNQRVLLLLLVLLIFPAFAFFGISGYDRFFAGDNAVAVVEESPISVQEFTEVRQAQVQNMRRILGDRFDPDLLDSATARNEILESLIQQRVLALHATQERIAVPDEALRTEIQRVPQFLNEQGAFDIERYRTMLSAQGQTEAMFEARLRADLGLQTIPSVIRESMFSPQTVARQIAARELEQRRWQVVQFEPADFVEDVAVDEAAARAFYTDNPEAFRAQEAAKLEYLILSQQALSDKLEVSDADISTYYESNRARYVQEEQRQARHILLTLDEDASDEQRQQARAKAQELRDRLLAGEDFAEVARTESQDPGSAEQGGDLGWFDRETMTKPFADAAFSLASGELSEIVETEFGLHLIELTDVREVEQKPLAEVRDEIDSALRSQKSRQRFLELAESFSNSVYEQPDGLAATADKIGIEVAVIDRLERSGIGAPEQALADARVLRAVFSPESIRDKTNIEAVDVGNNTLVSARILEHFPSKIQAFEDVEAQAMSAVRARKAAELAKAAGEAALEKIRAGGDIEKPFADEQTTTRSTAAIAAPAARAIFNADAGTVPVTLGVDLAESGYVVAQLLEVIPATEKAISEAMASISSQQASLAGDAMSEAYLQFVAQSMTIERFPDRITATPSEN